MFGQFLRRQLPNAEVIQFGVASHFTINMHGKEILRGVTEAGVLT